MSPVSGVTRMNIAALDDKELADLRAYFIASAECATNRETRAEAADYLVALTEEIALRRKEATS